MIDQEFLFLPHTEEVIISSGLSAFDCHLVARSIDSCWQKQPEMTQWFQFIFYISATLERRINIKDINERKCYGKNLELGW